MHILPAYAPRTRSDFKFKRMAGWTGRPLQKKMSANRQHRLPAPLPEAAFARALRRLQKAIQTDSEEDALARALCDCAAKARCVTGCAVYLDSRVAASTANWAALRSGAMRLPLRGGESAIGALRIAVSDRAQWAMYDSPIRHAIGIVALRIENLRQSRALRAREEEIAGLSAARDREAERCERAARHAYDFMQYIIGNAESGIAVFDREMRYLHVSRRYLQELNAQDIDVIGKSHYEVFPEIPQVWREVHQRALRGEPSSAESDPFERADGSIYWTRWECLPWYDADGGIGGIVLYTEVINEQMAAEDERRRLRAQLVQAQKMESIGRLAGGIAHDFNNLLTVINGYSAMALDRLGPGDPLADDLREIRTAGERAAALTRQLLAFSRKQILQPRALDLNQIVRGLEPMLPRLLGERVRLRLSFHPDRLAVFADQHQLEQVIVNLAVNARDAMPEGGEITLETMLADLDEAAARALTDAKSGRYAVLSVRDTGAGMDETTRQKIFEPFFTTKPAGEGTGLGLSMVHGIVAQSGGFIEVTSEPGRGSTFRIHLPVTEGEHWAAPGEVESLAGRGEATVVVVEDQDEVRRYVAEALKSYGYRCLPCGNAAEALEICERAASRVDLVLTDLIMPDMGGRELAQRLAVIRSGIPVVLMSGYTGDAALEQERPENAFFLQKPFSPAELAEKVSAALLSRRGPGRV